MADSRVTGAIKHRSGEEMDLSVDLSPGLRLANPVMIASGTLGYDGYGRGLTGNYSLHELGAVIPKTVTRWPREGNPEPRWFPESYRVAWDEATNCSSTPSA